MDTQEIDILKLIVEDMLINNQFEDLCDDAGN